jgi:hypothetical protein
MNSLQIRRKLRQRMKLTALIMCRKLFRSMDSEAVRRVGSTLVEYSVRQCCDIQGVCKCPAEERYQRDGADGLSQRRKHCEAKMFAIDKRTIECYI